MESGIETSVSVFVLTLGCLFVLKILGSKNSPCFFSSSTFNVPVLFWNFLLVCLSLISPLLCCIKQSPTWVSYPVTASLLTNSVCHTTRLPPPTRS